MTDFATVDILVVDDSQSMRRLIDSLLKQIGFKNVAQAPDGVTALKMLREGNFGAIVSDWNMEPMTGLDLLKEVRADAKLKGLPFLMVTGENRTENVLAAREAGVNDYVLKPFTADNLKQKLGGMIK